MRVRWHLIPILFLSVVFMGCVGTTDSRSASSALAGEWHLEQGFCAFHHQEFSRESSGGLRLRVTPMGDAAIHAEGEEKGRYRLVEWEEAGATLLRLEPSAFLLGGDAMKVDSLTSTTLHLSQAGRQGAGCYFRFARQGA